MTIYRTIGELVAALQKLDQNAVPYSIGIPFTGVQLVAQDNGKVLIAPPPREPKDGALQSPVSD
jgi:hypothetical protein